MEISISFAQPFYLILLVLVAVSSLQAQETATSDTNTTKLQSTIADSAAKPNEWREEVSVLPIEKIELRPAFKLPKQHFFFNPKNTDSEVNTGSENAGSEQEKIKSLPVVPRRGAKLDFPANQTSAPTKQTSAAPYVRAPPKERFKDYIRNVVGPYSLLGTAVFAGIFQYRDLPPEWENDSKGYARRFASALGILAINETTVYALDEAFKLDSDYYKSTKKTIKGRLQDSIVNTLMARKPDGKRVFGFPRIAGNYSSAIIADTTWYPKRFGVKDGIVDGTYSIGVDILFNIAREFLFKGK